MYYKYFHLLAFGCISSAPRTEYAPASSGGSGAAQVKAYGAPNLVDPERPIGAAETPLQQPGPGEQALLGNRVSTGEFSSSGYNAEGGGPVANGLLY